MMKRIFSGSLFVALLLSALGGFAQGRETPQELVAAYVAAMNAKDEAALRTLYHPASASGLTPLQQQFFEESFRRELVRTIPEGYTSELVELESGVLPLKAIMEWSVTPQVQMNVSYAQEDGREVHIIRFLAKSGTKWFFACPMPNAVMLARYEAHVKEQAADGAGAARTGADAASAQADVGAAPQGATAGE